MGRRESGINVSLSSCRQNLTHLPASDILPGCGIRSLLRGGHRGAQGSCGLVYSLRRDALSFALPQRHADMVHGNNFTERVINLSTGTLRKPPDSYCAIAMDYFIPELNNSSSPVLVRPLPVSPQNKPKYSRILPISNKQLYLLLGGYPSG